MNRAGAPNVKNYAVPKYTLQYYKMRLSAVREAVLQLVKSHGDSRISVAAKQMFEAVTRERVVKCLNSRAYKSIRSRRPVYYR
jgi:hypothetical protein